MANIYLQVDFKTGNIFQFSKTKQEGYESHINTKSVESFRKIFKKGLYAKLDGVSIRDSNFGKEISVAAKLANGDTAFLNFPIFDQNRNIANYAESFITVLPSLKVGESYRFFPYNIKGDNDKYANIGVSVVLADVANESVIEGAEKPARLSYSYTKDGKFIEGDIPAVIWEEEVDGSKVMNAKAKKKFLYDILVKHSTSQPQQNSASETQAKPKEEKPKAEAKKKETVNDDLPF